MSFTTTEMQAVWCDGLGASSSKPYSDSLHYSNSISIRPPIKSPEEPLDVTSLASENRTYACSTMPAKTDTDVYACTHIHSNSDTQYVMFITKTHTHTNVSLSTPVFLIQSSLSPIPVQTKRKHFTSEVIKRYN